MALANDRRLIVIEIKRSGHTVQLEELQRLERYKVRLSKAQDKKLFMVMICGGTTDLDEGTANIWRNSNDREILTWSSIYDRTRSYYQHYYAVLEGDIGHDDFTRKEREVKQTREVLNKGYVYRSPQDRKQGLGPQDIDLEPEI